MADDLAIWADVARDLQIASEHASNAAIRASSLEAGEVAGEAAIDRQLAIAAILHHCYGALESVLDRLLRDIDGATPSGQSSHAELIELAANPKIGVRPAILSRPSATRMHRLRAFRHAFRHAYGQYDYGLASENVAVAVELVEAFRREIIAFAELMAIKSSG